MLMNVFILENGKKLKMVRSAWNSWSLMNKLNLKFTCKSISNVNFFCQYNIFWLTYTHTHKHFEHSHLNISVANSHDNNTKWNRTPVLAVHASINSSNILCKQSTQNIISHGKENGKMDGHSIHFNLEFISSEINNLSYCNEMLTLKRRKLKMFATIASEWKANEEKLAHWTAMLKKHTNSLSISRFNFTMAIQPFFFHLLDSQPINSMRSTILNVKMCILCKIHSTKIPFPCCP